MKSYKRYLSLLLCCVLSCGLFSFTANAEEVDTSSYKLNFYTNGGGIVASQVNILDGEILQKTASGYTIVEDKNYSFVQQLTFTDTTGATLFEKGRNYSFKVENLYFQYSYTLTNGSSRLLTPSHAGHGISYVNLIFADGTQQTLDNSDCLYEYNSRVASYSLSADFTPEKDVLKILFVTKFSENFLEMDSSLLGQRTDVNTIIGTMNSQPYSLKISVQSEEAGLLSGLIEWVKSLWATCESGFANIVKGITELPQKLWSLIEEGLKNLFVPDEQYMTDYSDRWDQLLEDRLGAVYQVCSIVTDSWDSIINADETNTISIPEVSIPLGETTFSFGGEDVKIVPDGFETLVTALKLIVGIVCTCLFINGLLKRYDEVMGVEQ